MRRITVSVAWVVLIQQFLLTDAAAKPARCVVISNGASAYDGRCDFSAEKGGSFSIKPIGRDAFDGATIISISVTLPGVAEVKGLTRDGINSRWGKRSAPRRTAPAGSATTSRSACIDL
jgi:hypothetical protein